MLVRILDNDEMICIVAVLVSIMEISSENICTNKIFRLSPLHNDLKPTEPPTTESNDSSRTLCSSKCFNDVTCSGFFYHYDGVCFTFSTRFRNLYFAVKDGMVGYGK